MTTLRLMLFSAIVLVVSGVSTSCTSRNDSVRIQDRIAIEQLMWDYIRALDSGNAEAYAALFAPDGQFGFVTSTTGLLIQFPFITISYKSTNVFAICLDSSGDSGLVHQAQSIARR
jgi:hypothetical protein